MSDLFDNKKSNLVAANGASLASGLRFPSAPDAAVDPKALEDSLVAEVKFHQQEFLAMKMQKA